MEWQKLWDELNQICKRLGLTLTDCRGYTADDLQREIDILKAYEQKVNK